MQPVHRLVHLFASQCIARRSWTWGHIACLEQSHACVPPCRGTTQCERCPPSHAAPASLQARVADVWFLEADTPPSRCSRRGALLGAGTMQPLWCSRPPSAAKNHGSGKLLHLSRLSLKDLAAKAPLTQCAFACWSGSLLPHCHFCDALLAQSYSSHS